MWELDYKESWEPRTWCFELWCWRRLLRVPWTARRSNQSILKEVSLNIHWKDWCWSWSSNTLATWCKELTHWKRPLCWERLKAEGDGDDRGWDGWMASPTHWTLVWASSRSWWWTCCPGMLQSMRSQTVGHSRAIKHKHKQQSFNEIWLQRLQAKVFLRLQIKVKVEKNVMTGPAVTSECFLGLLAPVFLSCSQQSLRVFEALPRFTVGHQSSWWSCLNHRELLTLPRKPW